MSINIQQLILEAQKMANRNKELVALSNSLLVEAESNNRTLEAMRQFQDDMDSLNKLARNKSNSDMINRINQQNPSIRETRNENRELKATLEDHQRVLEMVMQKYREHTQQNVFKSQINFKELYNEKLLEVIRKQAEKINEMAAVMQKAAQADDDDIFKEIEWNIKLKTENQALRELLQIANDFDSTATLRSNVAGGSNSVIINNTDDNNIIIDDDKNNLLLHNHIATSSTSSGYGTIATSSIQNSRIICRSCEDKAIQTELIQQQSINEQNLQQQQRQQQQQQNQKQSESLQLTPNKSLDDDDDDDNNSVIENKHKINLIKNDNDQMVLNTMKILNQVLENGNSNNINIKNKNNAPENSEQNSNNNSPNKIQQQQQQPQQQQQFNENNTTTIKIKKEQNLNNENNKNNIEITKQNISETNIVDINDLSKLNLTNGTIDIIVDNNDTKQQQQQIQNNDSRLNNTTIEITTATTVKTENQENNNKTTVSS